MAETKKLSKETLNKCFWTWEWTYQACYNYENMQGGCFLDAMAPAIRELYPAGSEEFKESASRHFEFYNIENTLGGGVLGLVLAMEEQIASGEDGVTPDSVRAIKTGLMGPLSGVGDSYMQGVIYPIILAIGCSYGVQGNTFVPIIVILLQAIIQISIARGWFNLAYSKGSDAILDLLESGTFKNLLTGAGILGCMVLGALIMNFVSVHCGITINTGGEEPFSLQAGLFDTLLPGILPLAATLMCYALISKGWSSTKVLLLLVAIGVVGSVTGILA